MCLGRLTNLSKIAFAGNTQNVGRQDAKSRITQRDRWSVGLEGFATDDVSVHVDGRDFSELDCVLDFAGGDWKSVGVSGYCDCLLYTSPSPRDGLLSRMPSSA